jgi:hypothetical protein
MKCEYCESGNTIKIEVYDYAQRDFYVCRDCGKVTVI